MRDLTVREKKYLTNINTETEKMALGPLVQSLIDVINDGVEGVPGPQGPAGPAGAVGPAGENGVALIETGTPVNAVSAQATLLIDGPVIHGETVSITNEGTDVYEFVADAALTTSAPGNIPVDLNLVAGKAVGSLTVDTNPALGDTFTIGTKVYTFVPAGTGNADGEVDLEALLAGTQENIVAAIQGTDGHNDPHPLATCQAAFVADALVVRALIGGVEGNDIDTTETFTTGSNVFAAAKLQNGTNCSAANAITALVAAVTASDTQGVGAVDATGGNVTLTSDAGGLSANAIAVAADMVNGEFVGGATTLLGGLDGTIGLDGQVLKNGSWLYICTGDQEVTDKKWRRITLGSVY